MILFAKKMIAYYIRRSSLNGVPMNWNAIPHPRLFKLGLFLFMIAMVFNVTASMTGNKLALYAFFVFLGLALTSWGARIFLK